jgi:hypothetical protein
MTKKVLQPTNDTYIQFTEEELSSIGAGPGTKFSVKHHEDGSIELRPYVKMEIDISEWPRELLEMIISDSCEQDISVNDVVANLLKKSLEHLDVPVDDNKDKILLNEDVSLAGNIDPTGSVRIDPNFTNNDTSITNQH